jgi:hypothetical protein
VLFTSPALTAREQPVLVKLDLHSQCVGEHAALHDGHAVWGEGSDGVGLSARLPTALRLVSEEDLESFHAGRTAADEADAAADAAEARKLREDRWAATHDVEQADPLASEDDDPAAGGGDGSAGRVLPRGALMLQLAGEHSALPPFHGSLEPAALQMASLKTFRQVGR